MIQLQTEPADSPLTGKSKWWGEPDMPQELNWPEITVTDEDGEEYHDPLTFVCQIRCEDIAALDSEELLPHEGMLYFFAALDYFLGDFDTPAYPGMGRWQPEYFCVLYAPSCTELHTHHLNYPDNSPATLPAEAITFSTCSEAADGLRLLGQPYIEEVSEAVPGALSLLQIDGEDRWNLIFHDCGTLNYLIQPKHLKKRQWDKVSCYLFSF
ncbi:MAG: DUF1963 domain-containing protein [Bacteroidaceae bacterium]|nr:DUF1963 domain-containing protein [Bacteroidaceae bacterium]